MKPALCSAPRLLLSDLLRSDADDCSNSWRSYEFDAAAGACELVLDGAARQAEALESSMAAMSTFITTLEDYLQSIQGQREAEFFAPVRVK